jgi:hypothetical protein
MENVKSAQITGRGAPQILGTLCRFSTPVTAAHRAAETASRLVDLTQTSRRLARRQVLSLLQSLNSWRSPGHASRLMNLPASICVAVLSSIGTTISWKKANQLLLPGGAARVFQHEI